MLVNRGDTEGTTTTTHTLGWVDMSFNNVLLKRRFDMILPTHSCGRPYRNTQSVQSISAQALPIGLPGQTPDQACWHLCATRGGMGPKGEAFERCLAWCMGSGAWAVGRFGSRLV